MKKIRLILADDHPLIREGFRSLLSKSDHFEIVAEAESGIDLIEKATEHHPDIVLVDITMPQLNGLQAIERLKETDPSLKFIILSMHEEREYVLQAIKTGAQGYLLKNVEHEELERAIRTVYDGGKYYSSFVTHILAESISKPENTSETEITLREKEVLNRVANGQSTKQIASELNISIRTVESHRINMLRKLKVNNSAELIRKAIELKILNDYPGKP